MNISSTLAAYFILLLMVIVGFIAYRLYRLSAGAPQERASQAHHHSVRHPLPVSAHGAAGAGDPGPVAGQAGASIVRTAMRLSQETQANKKAPRGAF
ncbi:hypothetical protein [Aeromonas intestinalis]